MNSSLGKLFIVIGIISIIVGVLFLLNINIPKIGKLPGDIVIKTESTTFYFPVVTCIILSVVLSVIMWIVSKF